MCVCARMCVHACVCSGRDVDRKKRFMAGWMLGWLVVGFLGEGGNKVKTCLLDLQQKSLVWVTN